MTSYLTGREPWDVITGSLEHEGLTGSLVESVVLSHLRMYGEIPLMKDCSTFLWYYYNRQGREMDAIMRGSEGFLGIEVKSQRSTDKRSILRIDHVNKSFLLSKMDFNRGEGFLVVPGDIFLSLLPVSRKNL